MKIIKSVVYSLLLTVSLSATASASVAWNDSRSKGNGFMAYTSVYDESGSHKVGVTALIAGDGLGVTKLYLRTHNAPCGGTVTMDNTVAIKFNDVWVKFKGKCTGNNKGVITSAETKQGNDYLIDLFKTSTKPVIMYFGSNIRKNLIPVNGFTKQYNTIDKIISEKKAAI